MTKSLNTTPNIAAPDDFYEALLNAHRDLSREQSEALNARLILLLSNHIGEMRILTEALRIARDNLQTNEEIIRQGERHGQD